MCVCVTEIEVLIYISRALAHSGQMISASSEIKPRPTRDVLQLAQMKQSLCQCRSSNEIKRVPPIPVFIIISDTLRGIIISFTFCLMNNYLLRLVKLTRNWFGACGTSFSKKFSETVGTIRLVITTGKTLAS